jgi:hypothetical protein
MTWPALMPDLRRIWASAASTTARHRHEPGCGVRAAMERATSAPRAGASTASCSTSCRATLVGRAAARGLGFQPTRLASDSSATSSIHSTTERHTRPTTLRRWPGCGGTRRGALGLARRSAPGGEGLGAVGRDTRRAAPPSCTPTAPAAAARMMPSLGCCHSAASRRQLADGFLEVADHGKAEGRQPRRHVVDPGTAAATAPAAVVGRRVQRGWR